MLYSNLGDHDWRRKIDSDNLLIELHIQRAYRIHLIHNARIVNHKIHLSELLDRVFEELCNLALFGNVTMQGQDFVGGRVRVSEFL